MRPMRQSLAAAIAISAVTTPALSQVPSAAAGGAATAFLAENAHAMDRMMSGMHVAPTGDVDRDFVAMMVPHHQGAIDMAVAELKYGRNTQLKRIAQEIIVDQQQEITAMRLALGDPLPAPVPAPTQTPPRAGSAMPGHPHSDGEP